jgi:hypothetical protein
MGRHMKHAETIDGALAPALTEWDQRVLAAVPISTLGQPASASAWEIAERVKEDDVAYVRSTLRGLYDRRLVNCSTWQSVKLRRWFRLDLDA